MATDRNTAVARTG